MQFQILRKKGTEPAGSGLYNKHKEKGEYTCAGCGTVRCSAYTNERQSDQRSVASRGNLRVVEICN